MYHNRSFFISFILISLILSTFSINAEINILPKIKPKIIDSDKTFSGIIKPKKKPNINNEIIIETKKTKPTKNEFLLPIKKPLIVKKRT